jgi:hypothetical protein
MKYNENAVYQPGNQYPKAGDVAPFASLPAWWRRFIFQVLNGRELQVYLYIVMMVDADNSVAYPTINSIQSDMGLSSDTQVFGALRNLVSYGFILRNRMQLPNRQSRLLRNVYQRAAPEFTLLELLKRGRVSKEDGIEAGDKAIDEFLNFGTCPTPVPADPYGFTAVPKDVARGLERLLGIDAFHRYELTRDGNKRDVLMKLLQDRLDQRIEAGERKYAAVEVPPRDRQREEARQREKAIAAAGGVAAVAAAMPEAPGFDEAEEDGEIPF